MYDQFGNLLGGMMGGGSDPMQNSMTKYSGTNPLMYQP